MTMTIEETTTATGTLREQREAAQRRLDQRHVGPNYNTTDPAFNIPAGYRIIPDTDYQARHDSDSRFVVSSVLTDSLFGDDWDRNVAGRLGLSIAGAYPTAGQDGWIAPSMSVEGRHVPSCYVSGAWVRSGAWTVRIEGPSILVCFANGTIGRWHPSREDRPRGHSLEVVEWAGATDNPLAMDFDGRDWVPVEAVTGGEDTPAGPFSSIPAGWKIDPDTPGREVTSPGQDMYILSVNSSFLPERADRVGTIQKGFYSSGEWIFIDGTGYYAEAAKVNPALRALQYYYIESTNEVAVADLIGQNLRRINEDGRRGAILSAQVLQTGRWIRVVRDGTETNLQSETAAFPFPVGMVPESPTLGLESSTSPELNPTPVAGGVYVAWPKTWSEGDASQVLYCLADETGALWFTDGGKFRSRTGHDTPVQVTTIQGATPLRLADLEASYQWIKAAPKRLEFGTGPMDNDIAIQLTRIDERKETYSDALNELADENDWCSEFEQVVQAMDFPGRNKRKDFEVTVQAEIEWEDDSPSARMDRTVETEVFNGNIEDLSLSTMKMSGTLTVSLVVEEVNVAGGEDEAIRERVSNSTVAERIQELMDGEVTVTDYTIIAHEETEQ